MYNLFGICTPSTQLLMTEINLKQTCDFGRVLEMKNKQ